jgi:hypothetical protein
MPQQQKMISSANNIIVNNNLKKKKIHSEKINDDDEEEEKEIDNKCQCSKLKFRQCHRMSRDVGSLVMYAYMWITLFAICCSGLPPVIKIGKLFLGIIILLLHYHNDNNGCGERV